MPTKSEQTKSDSAVAAGKIIRTCRKTLGWSIGELSKKTDGKLSPSRIGNYEQGLRELGIGEAKILAEALEVPACYLMGLIDDLDRQLLEYDVAIKMKIVETMKVTYRPLEERLAENVRRIAPTPRHPTVKRRMRR